MARDRIHDIVIIALEKDGWDVTDDPLYVEYGINQKGFEVDLGAEKLLAAKKGNRRIAVEIKDFSGSIGNKFHTALGQFLDYEAALLENSKENDRTLYIALPDEIYVNITNIPFFVRRIQQHGLRFILINLENETIVKWID